MATINVSNNLEDFSIELNVNEGRAAITIVHYNGDSKKVVVPASIAGIPVNEIGDWVFSGHEEIKQVILPEGITSIGDYAFDGCKQLANINLPQSLASVKWDAFKNCERLANINIPKGLVDIGDGAFAGCGKLTEFTVDENSPFFTVVDGVLFDKNMTTLISFPAGKKGDYAIPDEVVKVAWGAFEGCNEITRIHIPQNIGGKGDSFNHFTVSERLTGITVSEQNPEYSGIDGVLFNKGATALFRYPQGRENKDYTVSDGVNTIGHGAFNDCKWLADIILPEGLEVIEPYAFTRCERLTAITLPMTLKYIGEKAFNECANLKTITLSRNTKLVYRALEGFSGRLVYRD